jgi:acetamidase/formamidase
VLHELPLDDRTLHGYFSSELEPVLEVDPGDSVAITVPNSLWYLDSGEEVARDREVHGGHALAGPIALRGARAGQTLAVTIEEVGAASWGFTPSEDGGVRWELGEDVGRGLEREVDLAPFLGVIGMPPPEPGRHSTRPPRRWGGNIDCKEVVAGTTLYLPTPVDGALLSAGDGHAAQGDGEVAGWAIETPVEARLTLDVRDDVALEWPIARTPDAWLAFGFDEDLDRAAQIALAGILAVMKRELGVSGGDALVLAGVGVDLRITQVVNETQGVHAVLRDDAFRWSGSG